MGRPKSQNPKTKHIGIVTTPEKFLRFKALGLIGDEAIDALLYHMENKTTKLNVQRMQIISKIKSINEEIEHLEYERLKMETQLEEINQSIGIADNGLRRDINKAVEKVIQRYENVSEIYTITEFMEMNTDFIEVQSFLANITADELKQIILETI